MGSNPENMMIVLNRYLKKLSLINFLIGVSFFLLSSCIWAQNTVTAVTNVTGSMSNVTIQSGANKYRYSVCNNLTPYTYKWNVNDTANISVNVDGSVWTLNDLTTAAIAVCIVQTPA